MKRLDKILTVVIVELALLYMLLSMITGHWF